MKLFHYTNIDSLASILKNRTMMFSRLDTVDDLEECIHSSNINIGQYCFISCWTEEEEESIPMWRMYTKDGLGVRICLDEDMFEDYLFCTDEPIGECDNLDMEHYHYTSKIKMSDMLNNPYYCIAPITNNSHFLKKVNYVDDVKAATSDAVSQVQDRTAIFGVRYRP